MKILLTGGTGFIGGATAKKLRSLGYRIKFFTGDVCHWSDWKKNLEDGQIILHLAGIRTESPKDYVVNVLGTKNLFKAIETNHKIPAKIIFASSQSVYFGCRPPFTEDCRPKPATIYGRSKLNAEKVSQSYCRKLGITLIILRYSTVLGPGIREKSNMSGPLWRWLKVALKGQPIQVFQDGQQNRDYVHIDDVVAANVLAVTSLPAGIYNVGGGNQVRLLDLAKWVREATQRKAQILIKNTKTTPVDPKEVFSDLKKLRQFGWLPHKKAKEAVREFVKSQREAVENSAS